MTHEMQPGLPPRRYERWGQKLDRLGPRKRRLIAAGIAGALVVGGLAAKEGVDIVNNIRRPDSGHSASKVPGEPSSTPTNEVPTPSPTRPSPTQTGELPSASPTESPSLSPRELLENEKTTLVDQIRPELDAGTNIERPSDKFMELITIVQKEYGSDYQPKYFPGGKISFHDLPDSFLQFEGSPDAPDDSNATIKNDETLKGWAMVDMSKDGTPRNPYKYFTGTFIPDVKEVLREKGQGVDVSLITMSEYLTVEPSSEIGAALDPIWFAGSTIGDGDGATLLPVGGKTDGGEFEVHAEVLESKTTNSARIVIRPAA